MRGRTWLCLSLLPLLAAAAPPVEPGAGGLGPCIEALRRELPRHPNVSAATFDAQVRELQDLRPVIEAASRSQPEFTLPIWDYVARRADAERAAEGREIVAREAATLAAVERRHGVDAATAVAVLGVETDYGRAKGRYPVLDATLSRACLDLDSAERKRHFFAALWLLQEGRVRRDDFLGSWAGAFGMTQFMPGTFVDHMDGGDATRAPDIVHNLGDALATTARYLKALGWRAELPWGVEVRVPRALAASDALESDHACLAGAEPRAPCRAAAGWAASGVVGVDGGPPALPPATVAALLMPAGADGPAWLVSRNYRALWRYNRADAYALSIALLSDALRGAPPPRTPWPTDDPGLSRAELRELQALLLRGGHCELAVDGREGPLTTAAIRAEEGRSGLAESGRAGARLLGLLRAQAAKSAAAVCNAGSAPAR